MKQIFAVLLVLASCFPTNLVAQSCCAIKSECKPKKCCPTKASCCKDTKQMKGATDQTISMEAARQKNRRSQANRKQVSMKKEENPALNRK